MKKLSVLLLVTAFFTVTLSAKPKDKSKKKISSAVVTVASTSWSAAFADIAGIDEVKAIAPTNLRHPPEYEITTSDVVTINSGDFCIYAGFERMMKTLGEKLANENTQMIKIALDNSLATVKTSTEAIAKAAGTEKEQAKRFAEYETVILDARADCEKANLTELKVFCNKNQTYLAKELGLNIAGIFGPGPLTSEQLLEAKKQGYDLIIDNVHNPVGKPVLEVVPDAKYIEWRNFPETVERNALIKVIKANISKLFD